VKQLNRLGLFIDGVKRGRFKSDVEGVPGGGSYCYY